VSNVVNKITQIKKVGATTGASNVIESIDGLLSKLNLLKTKVIILELFVIPDYSQYFQPCF
jgi:hypothetical protein